MTYIRSFLQQQKMTANIDCIYLAEVAELLQKEEDKRLSKLPIKDIEDIQCKDVEGK